MVGDEITVDVVVALWKSGVEEVVVRQLGTYTWVASTGGSTRRLMERRPDVVMTMRLPLQGLRYDVLAVCAKFVVWAYSI